MEFGKEVKFFRKDLLAVAHLMVGKIILKELTIKILVYLLLVYLLSGCGKEEASESKEEGRVCKEPRGTHQGCCSSHGGFDNNNCSGEELLYSISGALVCDDGTLSPTCKY